MTYTTGIDVIRRLYTAYERADLEAFYKDLSHDIIWKESDGFPTPGIFRSEEEIVNNVFNVLDRDWDFFRFTLESLVDGNEQVVAVGTYRGIHHKTGRSFEARAAHMWRISDGKICAFEQFADTHLMQAECQLHGCKHSLLAKKLWR
jgi:ketosteroid isomerase-like protein